ncbi:MAG: 4Fe-4S dicluster domain-containing protein, partial [Hyphomicrobiales bacterium]|nr:4Fe-4S dicluster domain-containing protein [Hyphomicrobiales bacterium]
IYMCPWPRIQASLTDEWALNVSYRRDRGEPRGSLKKMKERAARGEPAGDCIDCGQCIAVCPTGIDIRDGIQLPCIQCGLCIDACDTVMKKIGKPTRLIAYDTDINIARRREGKHDVFKFIRARTVIYVVLIGAVAGFMAYTLATRSMSDINVMHDRNPLYVPLSEGNVRNGYTIRILNKHPDKRLFSIGVEGLAGARIEAVGVTEYDGEKVLVPVDGDLTREVRILVFSAPGKKLEKSTPITFRLKNTVEGEESAVNDYFKAP